MFTKEGEQLACETEGIVAASLDFDSFGTSLTASLPSCIVAC